MIANWLGLDRPAMPIPSPAPVPAARPISVFLLRWPGFSTDTTDTCGRSNICCPFPEVIVKASSVTPSILPRTVLEPAAIRTGVPAVSALTASQFVTLVWAAMAVAARASSAPRRQTNWDAIIAAKRSTPGRRNAKGAPNTVTRSAVHEAVHGSCGAAISDYVPLAGMAPPAPIPGWRKGQTQPHRGHRLAIGLRLSEFGCFLPTRVRVPDPQGLLTPQHYLRVYSLRGRVREEVNVVVVLDLVNVSQGAFVFIAPPQCSHRLLYVDVALGKHLLQSNILLGHVQVLGDIDRKSV